MPEPITIDLPQLRARALINPATINDENRTVEVVASTGSRVVRYDWWRNETWIEELSMKAEHLSLDRLRNGAPLLNSHRAWDIDDVLGVVESARLEDGEIVSTVRFHKSDDPKSPEEKAWRKIKSGVLRKVSIGYRIFELEDVTTKDDEHRVMLAVDWEPYEVSPVPVGADDDAGFRSEKQNQTNACKIVLRSDEQLGESNMPQPNTPKKTTATGGKGSSARAADVPAGTDPPVDPPAPAAPAAPATPAAPAERDLDNAVQSALAEDRARGASIRANVSGAGLTREFADGMVEEGIPVADANQRIIEELGKQDESNPTRSHARILVDGDEVVRGGIESCLMHRFDPTVELEGSGRQFMSMSMLEIGRQFLSNPGEAIGSKMALASRVMSTGDFPLLLANVGTKVLLKSYNLEPLSFEHFCVKSTMPDFKPVTRNRVGDFPDMVIAGENAEVTYGKFGEESETYALGTYQRGIKFTRKMLIDDDLGAFLRLMRGYGSSARRMKNDVVWALITSNPVMGDGTVLFHADHGNLGTGPIAEAGISAARKAMRLQTSVDGKRITVRPSHLLAPVDKQTTAEKFLRPVSATKEADVNIFSSQFALTTEPRLDDDSVLQWYMVANPADIDTIEYAYLEGAGEEPFIESMTDFDTSGFKMKALLDFAAKVIDWRAFYRSSGV